MSSYELSAKAARDLSDIYLYSARQFGSEVADHYVGKLRKAMLSLVDYPQMGRSIHSVRHGYRCVECEGHSIYYRPHKGLIRIERILHRAMRSEFRL